MGSYLIECDENGAVTELASNGESFGRYRERNQSE